MSDLKAHLIDLVKLDSDSSRGSGDHIRCEVEQVEEDSPDVSGECTDEDEQGVASREGTPDEGHDMRDPPRL